MINNLVKIWLKSSFHDKTVHYDNIQVQNISTVSILFLTKIGGGVSVLEWFVVKVSDNNFIKGNFTTYMGDLWFLPISVIAKYLGRGGGHTWLWFDTSL